MEATERRDKLPRTATAGDVEPPVARSPQLERRVDLLADQRLEVAVSLPRALAVVLGEGRQAAERSLRRPAVHTP